MSDFEAGFGSVEITPHNLGLPMVGYGTREHGSRTGNSQGVHDPLMAKALVVRKGAKAWALCALDLLAIDSENVAEARRFASRETGLEPEAILIASIHTHSGPDSKEAANWNRPLAELVAETIVQAWDHKQPARLAPGAGFLYGHSINRRWLDRPIDPGVGVLRIDDEAGKLLGVVVNFGLHAVVMGGDNLYISADYVGYMRSKVEAALGGACIFTNGGAADVNPLTETVRQQLRDRRAFVTMTGASYYGPEKDAVYIEERKGGTFAEAEIIGNALAEEVIKVACGLSTAPPQVDPWNKQAFINHLDDGLELIESQALGVGDFGLVAQPGEVFVETALDIKARLRKLGYRYPWVVSYANDWQSYLAPKSALPEEGYEVDRARDKRHSPNLQDRLWAEISRAMAESKE